MDTAQRDPHVRVQVPATLANLGSGYDALGMALTLHNAFEMFPASQWRADGRVVEASENLVFLTAQRAARRFGGEIPPLELETEERVLRSRGMGSSATARVAGLLAYQAFSGREVDQADQLNFLAEEEGHPDNAWAALLGGLVICGRRPSSVPVDPRWEVAVCSPDIEVSTPHARSVLPAQVSHGDAVQNLRNCALLIHGLRSGDLGAVQEGVEDRLHQPYRMSLIGPVEASFVAARRLGAAPFVGGSGSSLAAFVLEGDAQEVARALASPFSVLGVGTTVQVLRPSRNGAVIADVGPSRAS